MFGWLTRPPPEPPPPPLPSQVNDTARQMMGGSNGLTVTATQAAELQSLRAHAMQAMQAMPTNMYAQQANTSAQNGYIQWIATDGPVELQRTLGIAGVGLAFIDRDAREAQDKSIALLKRWLSSEQAKQYEERGYFDVVGSDGQQYEIHPSGTYRLERVLAKVEHLCFGPEGMLPTGDMMLARKIALETDEPAARKIANKALMVPA